MSQKNSRAGSSQWFEQQKTGIKTGFLDGGSDEARTRDPMRDRHVF